MNNKNLLLGGRKNGQTLEHLIKDIKLISEFSKQYELNNYIFYVDKQTWERCKEALEPKCKEANIKVVPTDFLPKSIVAYYTKKLTHKEMQEFIENKEREKYDFKSVLKGIRI